MPAEPKQLIEDFEGKVSNIFGTAMAIGGSTLLQSKTVFFVTEMLFSFIRLGKEVRARVLEQRHQLDMDFRAQGIFHTSVNPDISAMVVRNFFRNEAHHFHEELAAQFDNDLKIASDPTHPDRDKHLEILKYAHHYFFDYLDNLAFDTDPQLQEHVRTLSEPRLEHFREIICRVAAIKEQNKGYSLRDLQNKIPEYIQLVLQSRILQGIELKEDHVSELSGKISDIFNQTILEGDEMIDKTLGYVVFRKLQNVEQELERAQHSLMALDDPDNHLSEVADLEARRRALEKRMIELQDRKARLEGVASQFPPIHTNP